MSDCCSLVVMILKKDRKKLIQAFEGEEPSYETPREGNPAVLECSFESMNWAGAEELDRLAEAGIPFHGQHENGDEYPSELFACFKKKRVWVESLYSKSSPAVPYTRNGPDRMEVEIVKRYFATVDKVEEVFTRGSGK